MFLHHGWRLSKLDESLLTLYCTSSEGFNQDQYEKKICQLSDWQQHVAQNSLRKRYLILSNAQFALTFFWQCRWRGACERTIHDAKDNSTRREESSTKQREPPISGVCGGWGGHIECLCVLPM